MVAQERVDQLVAQSFSGIPARGLGLFGVAAFIKEAVVSIADILRKEGFDIPDLEQLVLSAAKRWFDAWAEGDNENLPDAWEDAIEAGLWIVIEATIKAVL